MNDVLRNAGASASAGIGPSQRPKANDAARTRPSIGAGSCPVIGFVAFSGTGKTTLLRRLLPLLKQSGLTVGMVKHAHHAFEIDTPGKDSYELRKAGADRMLIGSRNRFALMVEKDFGDEPDLRSLLDELGHDALDLVLVEGFKHERYDKIELFRPSLGKPPMFPDDPHIVAVATDMPPALEAHIPVLDLNSPANVAQFVMQHAGLKDKQQKPLQADPDRRGGTGS